jgi:hypothetical protein
VACAQVKQSSRTGGATEDSGQTSRKSASHNAGGAMKQLGDGVASLVELTVSCGFAIGSRSTTSSVSSMLAFDMSALRLLRDRSAVSFAFVANVQQDTAAA